MQITLNWSRTLSLSLALVYVALALVFAGAEGAVKTAFMAVLPLACIWGGEAMGGYVGPNWGGSITNSSPGLVFCILGWMLLLLPLIFIWA